MAQFVFRIGNDLRVSGYSVTPQMIEWLKTRANLDDPSAIQMVRGPGFDTYWGPLSAYHVVTLTSGPCPMDLD